MSLAYVRFYYGHFSNNPRGQYKIINLKELNIIKFGFDWPFKIFIMTFHCLIKFDHQNYKKNVLDEF